MPNNFDKAITWSVFQDDLRALIKELQSITLAPDNKPVTEKQFMDIVVLECRLAWLRAAKLTEVQDSPIKRKRGRPRKIIVDAR